MKQPHFPVIWLTGNTGAGKSTLAFGVREHFNANPQNTSTIARRVVVLDGNEMRATISTEEGFSPEDRRKHNLRVARLANLLSKHGFFVLVAVIAPFTRVREEVQKICNPKWVYVKRSGLERADRPYEPPMNPDLVIDNDVLSIEEAQSILLEFLHEIEKSADQREVVQQFDDFIGKRKSPVAALR